MNISHYSGFILINEENKILLQYRTEEAIIDPSCWAVFGGKFKNNESPEECVKRELYEELNLEIYLKFFKKFEFLEKDGLHISNVFFGFCNECIRDLRKKLREGKDLMFFNEIEIEKINLSNSSRNILKEFFKFLQSTT